MFKNYKNQIESAIMSEDVEDNLNLTNVEFTNEHVLAEDGKYLYLEVRITDRDDYVSTEWVALNDEHGLFFADSKPEGVQIPPIAV